MPVGGAAAGDLGRQAETNVHPVFQAQLWIHCAAKTPRKPGASARSGGGARRKCRFCHFGVLTGRRAPPYTPPSLETKQRCGAAAVRAENLKGQGCCRATGRSLLFIKLGSSASTDVDPQDGPRGQLFEIVKMEERETWTAKFLRTEPGCKSDVGQSDFDGTFLQEVHYQSRGLRIAVIGVCPRQ